VGHRDSNLWGAGNTAGLNIDVTDNKAIVDHTSHTLSVCSHHLPVATRNDPCCCMTLFAACALLCIVIGDENPHNCPFLMGFRYPARGGPSHGRRQRAQKNGKRSRVWLRRFARGQSDRQTHRHTHHNTSPPLPRANSYYDLTSTDCRPIRRDSNTGHSQYCRVQFRVYSAPGDSSVLQRFEAAYT